MVLRPPVQAEDLPWAPKVDRPGNEPQMSKAEYLEDNEQMDANESAASLPEAEEESSDETMFIGNRELKRTTSVWKTELPEVDTWASDFTNVEMRNQAFRKIVSEKTMLAHWSTPVCQSEVEIERELESHDRDDELYRAARVHMQFVCRMYKLQHDEGRYFPA